MCPATGRRKEFKTNTHMLIQRNIFLVAALFSCYETKLCYFSVESGYIIKYSFSKYQEQKRSKRSAGWCLNPISWAVLINMALSA